MRNTILILWATVAIWMIGAGYYFDSESLAPNPVNGYILATNGLESAWVPSAGGGSEDWKVMVSGADTTPDYLESKLVDGNGIDITKMNAGGDEVLSIAVNEAEIVPDRWFTFGTIDAATPTSTMLFAGGNGLSTAVTGNGTAATLTIGDVTDDVQFSTVTADVYTRVGDGSGNYMKWYSVPLAVDRDWSMPATLGGVGAYLSDLNGDGVLEWTTPAGTYTNEQAEDAVGAMAADTATIDVTYTDGTPELKWDLLAYIFKTIDCPSLTDPVADSVTDTLTFANGAGIDISGNSATDTVTIASTITQYTDELAQDICLAGTSLVAGAGITYAYDDAGNHADISSSITQYTDELAQDICLAGTSLVAGTGITYAYDDANNHADISCSITDTNTQIYSNDFAATTVGTSDTALGVAEAVLRAGTVVRVGIRISTWTVASTTDTLTVYIYIDGAAQGSWTKTVGGTGAFSGALTGGTNTVTLASTTVSHSVQVYAKRTTAGSADTIAATGCDIEVSI